MQYKLIFLTFLFIIFFFKNGFCMNLSDTSLELTGESDSLEKSMINQLLAAIEDNDTKKVRAIITNFPKLVQITNPIPLIIHAVKTEHPSPRMISILLEKGCNINPEHTEYKPTLTYILEKIYETSSHDSRDHLYNILIVLLRYKATITKKILAKYYTNKNPAVKEIIGKHLEPRCRCLIM